MECGSVAPGPRIHHASSSYWLQRIHAPGAAHPDRGRWGTVVEIGPQWDRRPKRKWRQHRSRYKPSAAPVRSKEIVYRVPTASLLWQRDRASLLYIQTNLSYCEHSSPKSASKFAHNPTYCRVIQGAGCNPSVHPLALVPLCRIRSAMSATKIDVHGLDDIVDAL